MFLSFIIIIIIKSRFHMCKKNELFVFLSVAYFV
jgi:hypothetical protein